MTVRAALEAGRPRRFPAIIILGLAALVGSCGGGGEDAGGAAGASESGAEEMPRLAPSYDAMTLDGEEVALADLRGEVVLLNVWATWCTPCRQEIPELQALHERHGAEGLRVVGVTVDSRGARDQVRRFIDDFEMTYDIWWDPDQGVVSTFGAVGVPLTVLIDARGRMVWRHLGAFQRGDPELRAAVDTALGALGRAPRRSSHSSR